MSATWGKVARSTGRYKRKYFIFSPPEKIIQGLAWIGHISGMDSANAFSLEHVLQIQLRSVILKVQRFIPSLTWG